MEATGAARDGGRLRREQQSTTNASPPRAVCSSGWRLPTDLDFAEDSAPPPLLI
jgi:hypothetical protein